MSEQAPPSTGIPSNVPNPDPSVRANEVMLREITSLRELAKSWTDALQLLHEEKFASVQTQFRERDDRVKQTSIDSRLAIDAALQAAKEAVGKSETSATKQIDDIKERMNKVEQAVLGAAGRTAGASAAGDTLTKVIAAISALVSVGVAMMVFAK